MSYQGKVYRKQGGDELVVASGGAITVETGGSLTVAGVTIDDSTLAVNDLTATAAELNALDAAPAALTFAAAAGGANVCEVTVTVKDAGGSTVAAVHNLDLWLSDADTGAGLTGTTASGTVTAKSASGIVLDTYTAKKALRVQTLATGVFILEITDSAKTGFYVAGQVPLTGATAVSDQLETADYGT